MCTHTKESTVTLIRTRHWKAIDRQRAEFIRVGESIIDKAFRDQLAPVFEAVEDSGNTAQIAIGLDAAFNPQIMIDAIILLYQRVGIQFARRTFNKFKGNDPDMELKQEDGLEDSWEESMAAYITTKGKGKVASINATTKKAIDKVVKNALQEGLSIDVAARQIRKRLKGISAARSKSIARTEIIGASNQGQLIGAESLAVPMEKEWISTIDEVTRTETFDHVAADGERVGLKEQFVMSGEPMDHPGDAKGSIGNVINCRCTVGFHPIR